MDSLSAIPSPLPSAYSDGDICLATSRIEISPMQSAHLFALGAAFSWTLASIFSHHPVRMLGPLHFNRLRMIIATVILLVVIVLQGGDWHISPGLLLPIIISSLVGVVLGDYFLFVAVRRLGLRRTGVLFAANAPIAALLGWLFLEEGIGGLKTIAICLGVAGICLAVLYGKRRDLLHVWEEITPPLWLGVGAGICAAFGQAIGILILRPVMEGGADPMMTTLVRVGFAAACFCLTWPFDKRPESRLVFPSLKIAGLITANSFFGISFGVVLLLVALETGSVADVTILSSITPVLILPFVWYQTRYCPTWGAWVGAILVCACSGLLVL